MGQSKYDSLISTVSHLADTAKIQKLNALAIQVFTNDLTLARQLVEKALQTSRTIGYAKGEGEASRLMCNVLTREGQFAQALTMCQKAEAIFSSLHLKANLALVYNGMGMIHIQQGQYPPALENFTKAVKIWQEENQPNRVTALNENIGMVYFRQEDYSSALKYFKDSYDGYKLQGNEPNASKILVNIGATYNQLKMPDKALEAHLQSLAFFEKVNMTQGMAIAYNNIGNVYSEVKNYPKAIQYFEKSLEVKKKQNDQVGIAVSQKNIAEAYLNTNDLGKAKQYIDQSLRIAEATGAKEQMKDAYEILSKIFDRTHDYEKALAFEKKRAQAKDSLFSLSKTEEISRMRALYETEKAEREAALANIKTAQKDASILVLNKENELKNSQRNYFIVAAALLLALALLAFYLFRQKQKSLREREGLLKEIHHRVKNNLQIISSLLSLQSKSLTDTDAQGAISESRNRVKSMSLIHEQLYQEDTISGVDMKDYMQRLVSSLTSSYGLDTERVEIKITADNILLDVDSAIPLGLIINELVSNSIKYAFPEKKSGTILVSLHEMMSELKLKVEDNGVGMDPSKKSNQSFGLSMVNSLMRKLKADMNIVSEAGTSVELVIRDFKKVGFGWVYLGQRKANQGMFMLLRDKYQFVQRSDFYEYEFDSLGQNGRIKKIVRFVKASDEPLVFT